MMICQYCHSADATMHVTDRLPSGQFIEVHSCRACWEGRVDRSSPGETGFPGPKLCSRSLLIVIAIFAVANSLAVWVMRYRPISQTPETRIRGIVSALVMTNACIGLVASYRWLSTWLQQVIWLSGPGMEKRHRRRGYLTSSGSDLALGFLGHDLERPDDMD